MTDGKAMEGIPAGDGQGNGNLCGARTRSGAACRKPAGWGTPNTVGRCSLHGGTTATHVKHARKVQASIELRRLGQPNVGADPTGELLAMVAEASGNVGALRDWVQGLGDDIYGDTYHPSGRRTGHAEEHVLVVMYREWCDRLVSYSAAAIRAGISERAVRVMEEQAELFAQVLIALLDDPEFGLSWEQREMGRRIAGRHLRALPVGA